MDSLLLRRRAMMGAGTPLLDPVVAFFNYRQTAGGASIGKGKAKIQEVRGKSLVWNQLVQNKSFVNTIVDTMQRVRLLFQCYGTSWIDVTENEYISTAQLYRNIITAPANGYIRGKHNGSARDIDIVRFNCIANHKYIVVLNFLSADPRIENGVSTDDMQAIDLTLMFGAGNEPSTVAEFEALYPLPYYAYNAGTLINNAATGLQSTGTSFTDTLALNITTATGKLNGQGNSVTIFPDGMKKVGSTYDVLTATSATKRIGSRAYQSGDESDTSVITDGTTTYYALATPEEYVLDTPLDLRYLVEAGGAEAKLPPLPDSYQRVEYLESSGTQYIDTGVVPTKNTKIEIHNIQKVTDTAFGVFGQLYVFNTNGSNYYSFGATPNSGTYTGASLVNLDATIVMSKDDGLVINGQQAVAFSNVNDFTTDLTFWLFARNSESTAYKMGAQRTYYFKMWNNGTLVRNLSPARRKTDSVLGMYDTVTKQFFTNDGTGSFTAGADVNTPDSAPLSLFIRYPKP